MKKSLIVLLSAIIAVNVSGCKKSSDKMRENTDSSKTVSYTHLTLPTTPYV